MVQVGGGGGVKALMNLFGGGGKSTAKLKPTQASEALAGGLKSSGVSQRKPSPTTDQNRMNMSNTAYRSSGSVPMSSMATSKASKLINQSHTTSSANSTSGSGRASSSSSSTFAADRRDLPLGEGSSGSGGGSGNTPITGLNLTSRLSGFVSGSGQDSASSSSGGGGSNSSGSTASSSSSSTVGGRSGSGSGGGSVSGHDYGSNVRGLRDRFESGAANNATGAASGGGAEDAAGVIRGGAVKDGQNAVSGIFDTSNSSGGVQGGRSGSGGGGSDSSGLTGGVSNSPREAARQTAGVSVSERAGGFGDIVGSGNSSSVDGASGPGGPGDATSASIIGSSVDPDDYGESSGSGSDRSSASSSAVGSSVDPENSGESSRSSRSSGTDGVDGGPGRGRGPSSPGAYEARLNTRNVDVQGAIHDIENRTEQPVDSPGRRDAEEATRGVSVSNLRDRFMNTNSDTEPVPISGLIEKARMHEAAISSPLAGPQSSSMESGTGTGGVDSSTSTDGSDGPILSSDNFVDGPFFDENSGLAGDSSVGTDSSTTSTDEVDGFGSASGSSSASAASAANFDEVDSSGRTSSTSGSNTSPYAAGPYGPGTSDTSGLSRDGLKMLANDILDTVDGGDTVDGIHFEEQAGGHRSTTGTIDGTDLAVQTGLNGPEQAGYTALGDMGAWMEDPNASPEDAPQSLRADSDALKGILGNKAMAASVLPIPLGQRGDTVIIENPGPKGPDPKIPFRVVFGSTDLNKDFGPTGSSNKGSEGPGDGEGGKVPSKGFRKFLQRFALPMGNAGASGVVAGGSGGGGGTTVLRGGGGGIMYTNNLDSVGGNSTAIITGGGNGGGLNSLILANGGGNGVGSMIMFTDGLTTLNREQLLHMHGQLNALMDTVDVLPPEVLNSEVQINMPSEGSADSMPRVMLVDIGNGGNDPANMSAEDVQSLRTDMTAGLQQLSNQVAVALSGGGSLDSISLSGDAAARGEASA